MAPYPVFQMTRRMCGRDRRGMRRSIGPVEHDPGEHARARIFGSSIGIAGIGQLLVIWPRIVKRGGCGFTLWGPMRAARAAKSAMIPSCWKVSEHGLEPLMKSVYQVEDARRWLAGRRLIVLDEVRRNNAATSYLLRCWLRNGSESSGVSGGR